jgi:peptidoglycan/LPS O-acetylase OafA/YrhL
MTIMALQHESEMKKLRSHNSSPQTGRFYWLDWLRFGAAFVVLVGHVRGGHFVDYGDLEQKDHTLFAAAGFALSRLGLEAVILFFVLSGFLVGGRSARKALNGSFDLQAYGIDRISRIYVPLLPALVLTGFIALFRDGHVSFFDFCGNLAGLQGIFVRAFGGNAPLWSLAYEIWFYLLWGGILTLAIRETLTARTLAWIIVLLGLAVFTKLEPVYLFCWLLGVLAYFHESKAPRRLCLIGGLLIIVLGVILSQLTSDSISLNLKRLSGMLPSHSVALLVLSIGFTVLVKTVAGWEPQSAAWRTFERMGTPLAAFSYTLYLTHFAMLGLWEALFPGRARELDFASLSLFLLKLLVCVFSAWVLYFLFERHTSKVRHWLSNIFAHWTKA